MQKADHERRITDDSFRVGAPRIQIKNLGSFDSSPMKQGTIKISSPVEEAVQALNDSSLPQIESQSQSVGLNDTQLIPLFNKDRSDADIAGLPHDHLPSINRKATLDFPNSVAAESY